MTSALFPLFADLRQRLVLVVGGGEVAVRKVAALQAAGARVRVGSLALHPHLQAALERGEIEFRPGHFYEHWLDDAW